MTFHASVPLAFLAGESVPIEVAVNPGIPNGPVAITSNLDYRPFVDFDVVGGADAVARVQSPTGGAGPAGGVLAFDPMVGNIATTAASGGLSLATSTMRVVKGNIEIRCQLAEPLVLDVPVLP